MKQTTNTNTMTAAMMASTIALEFDKRMLQNTSFEQKIQSSDLGQPVGRDELVMGKYYVADKERRYLTDGIPEREVFKVLGVFDEEHFWGSWTFKKVCIMNCRNGHIEEVYSHHYTFYPCDENE